MNSRATLLVLLGTTIIIFTGLLLLVILRFSLPAEKWTLVGTLAEFPPSITPYEIQDPEGFIVNLDGEILAFSIRPPHPAFKDTCRLRWDPETEVFWEPCGGARFALDGSYTFGPSPSGMNRFQVRIDGGEVWLETTTLIPGDPVPMGDP